MRFKTGKHAGKTIEEVVLKQPDYAQWYIDNLPASRAAKEFERLIKAFDEKPFAEPCQGCGGKAIQASAYTDSFLLMFWCGNCDPTPPTDNRFKIRMVRTFTDVVDHPAHRRSRKSKRAIVRALAEGKGLPDKVGEKEALAFFS